MKKIILVGGGTHAVSIINLLERKFPELKIFGYTDAKKSRLNVKYLGKDEIVLNSYNKNNFLLTMSIGVNIKIRSKVFDMFKKKKFNFLTIIDKNSVVASSAKIGNGSIIFPNSSIGPHSIIKDNVVIHTSTVVEHNSLIGKDSYLGPSAVICGNSKVGKKCLVGANSCMIENITLPNNSILGASALLNKNYKKERTYMGIPAK